MSEAASHGTRRWYQETGCRCTPCRAANATYQADLRRQRATGRLPLGARVSAVETWRKIRQLKIEHLTQAQLARRLGLKRPILELSRSAVTVRTALRIRRLHRVLLSEPPPAV